MKKAYLLLLLCICLLASCARATKDEDVFQLIPTTNPGADTREFHFASKQAEPPKEVKEESHPATSKFLIDRATLRPNGSNITVDAALSLIINQLTLPNSPTTAYKFLGYDSLEEGLCYVISYGTLTGKSFTENSRYAVSYNKTIYQAQIENGQVANYQELYSIDSGLKGNKNAISTSIKDGILIIKDAHSNRVISSFSLNKYNLENAKHGDILILDMNFDGYLDVAIRSNVGNDSYTYHAFLYQKKKKLFNYEVAYSYLPSPQYSSTTKTICCSTAKTDEYVYDTYVIVDNQPEISERLSYHYEKSKKQWRMEQYKGKLGQLELEKKEYYTSEQVSDLIGQFVTDN